MAPVKPWLKRAWGLFCQAMRSPFLSIEVRYGLDREPGISPSEPKRRIAVSRPRDGSGRFLPRPPPIEVVSE